MALRRQTRDSSRSHNRDIVVIGASAGGVEAVLALAAALPADLPAAVLIVVHVHPNMDSALPQLLTARGPLEAAHAVDGEPILPGRIYVAPPDFHLMVGQGGLRVVRGPRENGHRPAVDALFRSASSVYGPRVIGVVLTGYLDCGTAGLFSIKARGGIAIAQDPLDAAVPSMPQSAIDHVPIDHVVPLADIPGLLADLVFQSAGDWPARPPLAIEELEGTKPGGPAALVCPHCCGVLTEVEIAGFEQYRCHVGHSFSLRGIAAEQADEVERALWAAARALEESAALSGRIAARATGSLQERFAEKHDMQARYASTIKQMILEEDLLRRTDAGSVPDPPRTGEENDRDRGRLAGSRRSTPTRLRSVKQGNNR